MTYATKNLRIGWIGFHLEGIPALIALLESGVRIEGVITLREEALAKRSGAADYTTALQPYDVPLHYVKNINDPDAVALLRDMALDVAFVIGWSQIVRAEALANARVGMIGAHASYLPHNRGSAPINWALIKGEACSGNSLIWLAEGVDEGHIIDQVQFPISLYDTCASLYGNVAESNREMILRLIPRLLAGEHPGRPQEHTNTPILPRRRPEDGQIDWNLDSLAVYNFVRALTRPYPGAFSGLDEQRWHIWSCAVLPQTTAPEAKPGQILGSVFSPVEAACGQMVACGRGAVVLLEIESSQGKILRHRELSDQQWEGRIWTNG